jgi:hypothetical protein
LNSIDEGAPMTRRKAGKFDQNYRNSPTFCGKPRKTILQNQEKVLPVKHQNRSAIAQNLQHLGIRENVEQQPMPPSNSIWGFRDDGPVTNGFY